MWRSPGTGGYSRRYRREARHGSRPVSDSFHWIRIRSRPDSRRHRRVRPPPRGRTPNACSWVRRHLGTTSAFGCDKPFDSSRLAARFARSDRPYDRTCGSAESGVRATSRERSVSMIGGYSSVQTRTPTSTDRSRVLNTEDFSTAARFFQYVPVKSTGHYMCVLSNIAFRVASANSCHDGRHGPAKRGSVRG